MEDDLLDILYILWCNIFFLKKYIYDFKINKI